MAFAKDRLLQFFYGRLARLMLTGFFTTLLQAVGMAYATRARVRVRAAGRVPIAYRVFYLI